MLLQMELHVNVELGERVLGTQQMTGTELLRVANLNNMEVEGRKRKRHR
jgi:hypothetical protein